MERVTVAELKSRLSHYLREVREGKSFTVVSRDIPVATLGPVELDDWDDLDVIPPDPRAPGLFEPVLGHPPAGLPDAAELIRADRDDRDERLAEIVREALRSRRDEDGGEAV
jgi:prevent-host-death family protein